MRRRGASAAFARNPELQIGFGTLCELILGGLAPKGPNYIHNLPINRILRPYSYEILENLALETRSSF